MKVLQTGTAPRYRRNEGNLVHPTQLKRSSRHRLVCALALCCCWAAVTWASENNALEALASDAAFLELVEKIGSAEIKPSNDLLIIGGMYGGQLLVSAIVTDPLMPDTLDVYFDQWNEAARAHLLVAYAEALVAEDNRAYSGLTDQEQREQHARDEEQRTRMDRIVAEGKYTEDWAPFVEAYRAFLPAARASVIDLESHDPWDAFVAVNAVAREAGLNALVQEVRIEPEHAATEMLRIVRVAYQREGLIENANEFPQERLLYSCGSPAVVRVASWHPLAAAFFDAWSAENVNPDARKIVESYRDLSSQFAAWTENNKKADTGTRDARLREMANSLGLFELIAAYEASSNTTDN